MLHQTGVQSRTQRQNVIVEVIPAVVQKATADTIFFALPNAHIGAGLDLQHERKIFCAQHVVRDLEPSMGAEDFSFMLQVKPGAYMRIGQGEENGVGSCFLHNSRYDFNDDILPLGAALHASLVEHAMPIQSP